MALCLLVPLLLLGPQEKTAPPFTKEQYDKVRELVQRTQEEAAQLQAELEKRQRELVRRYGSYELDLAEVEKLQTEVHELQRKLLANYHKMQVELRAVVGKDRFAILHQRLSQVIADPLSKPAVKEKQP